MTDTLRLRLRLKDASGREFEAEGVQDAVIDEARTFMGYPVGVTITQVSATAQQWGDKIAVTDVEAAPVQQPQEKPRAKKGAAPPKPEPKPTKPSEPPLSRDAAITLYKNIATQERLAWEARDLKALTAVRESYADDLERIAKMGDDDAQDAAKKLQALIQKHIGDLQAKE